MIDEAIGIFGKAAIAVLVIVVLLGITATLCGTFDTQINALFADFFTTARNTAKL